MKLISQIYVLMLVFYIIIYKAFLVSSGEIIYYIINTLVWISFSVVGFIFLYRKNKHYYKYERDIIYITIISSLLYIFLFYSFGFFRGFSNNPYSQEPSVIIINLFNITLVIGLKEYIRGILINEVLDRQFIYKIIITLMFIISEINIIMIVNNLGSADLFFDVLIKSIIPIISINLFATFLCIKGGLVPGIIYRIIVTFPKLLIPVAPKYDVIIPMLFDVLFPLFTYIVIMYQINRRDKYNKEIPVKPISWISIFLITLFSLMFSLGVFSIKPVVILTGSMKPSINEGDLLIIENCQIEDIDVEDIIEFGVEDYRVVHRVIKISKSGNGISLVTKGDNNIKEDKLPVTSDNLIGCFKYRIPYLGYPAYLVRRLLVKNVNVETGS